MKAAAIVVRGQPTSYIRKYSGRWTKNQVEEEWKNEWIRTTRPLANKHADPRAQRV